MDSSTLLKTGTGRNGRDLLVPVPAHNNVMLPLASVLGEQKNSGVSF